MELTDMSCSQAKVLVRNPTYKTASPQASSHFTSKGKAVYVLIHVGN
jgi:hypothetical protein